MQTFGVILGALVILAFGYVFYRILKDKFAKK